MPREKIKRTVYGFRVDEKKAAAAEEICLKKKTTLREQLELRVEEIAENPKTIKKV